NRERPREAVTCYGRALQTGHPDAAKIHYFMGRQKIRDGDIAGGIACFRSFVLDAAEAQHIERSKAEAWSMLEDGPEFDPQRFHGYLYLAGKCRESGLNAPAVHFLRTSIMLEPLVTRAQALLTEMLYLSNRRREALRIAGAAHRFQLRHTHPHLRPLARWSRRRDGPDFMIIGKLKCGTTSLYRYLTQHPCILPALAKETQFV